MVKSLRIGKKSVWWVVLVFIVSVALFLGISGCGTKEVDIRLQNQVNKIDIPDDASTVNLYFGSDPPIKLSKLKVLQNEKYHVVGINTMITDNSNPSGKVPFCTTIVAVPAEVQAAMDKYSNGPYTPEDIDKIRAAVNDINNSHQTIDILPIDKTVGAVASKIKIEDTITTSGILYKENVFYQGVPGNSQSELLYLSSIKIN